MDSANGKKLEYEELVVLFDGLRELLREILKHYADSQFDAELVNFRSPFRNFVWQWDELTQACEPFDTDTEKRALARKYLKEAMELIKASEDLDSYFKSYASSHAGGTITFEYLWTIFPPGAKVLARSFLDKFQTFEVQYCKNAGTDSGDITFVLVITGFDWDGADFNRASYRLSIPAFQGSMPVRNLPCLPISFYQSEIEENGEKLNADLLARGRKFVELCTSKAVHHEYQGRVLYHIRRDDSDSDSEDGQLLQRSTTKSGQLRRSEIIVDNSSFMRSSRCPANGSLPLGAYVVLANPSFSECPCSTCRSSLTQDWSRNLHKFETKQMQYDAFKKSNELLLLCPPKVLGYSLKLNRWAQFGVENVQPIGAHNTADLEEAFNKKLRINSTYKKLIKVSLFSSSVNRLQIISQE